LCNYIFLEKGQSTIKKFSLTNFSIKTVLTVFLAAGMGTLYLEGEKAIRKPLKMERPSELKLPKESKPSEGSNQAWERLIPEPESGKNYYQQKIYIIQ
jgi:hypothetical protein